MLNIIKVEDLFILIFSCKKRNTFRTSGTFWTISPILTRGKWFANMDLQRFVCVPLLCLFSRIFFRISLNKISRFIYFDEVSFNKTMVLHFYYSLSYILRILLPNCTYNHHKSLPMGKICPLDKDIFFR